MSGPPEFPLQHAPPGALPPFGFPPGRPLVNPPPMLYPGPPGAPAIPVVLPPGVPPPGPMFPPTVPRPGMMPRPGQPRPVTLPRPGAGAPIVMPPPNMSVLHKSTSVYVGKIANTVNDEVMLSLLVACGEVRSWKRQEDPETKQPKGFGFCEFADAEGVVRALRLLSNLMVDGQELLVKSNSATQRYVEAYEREKEQKDREDKEEGEHQDSDEARDNEVLEKIMTIISDREDHIKKAKAEQENLMEQHGGGKDRSDSDSTKDRGRHGDRRERDKDLEFDKKREKERREVEAKKKEETRAYERKLHDWERVERKRQKERDREKERQRDVDRERHRHVKADLEFSDSDDDRYPWERRTSNRNNRHKEERRNKRKEEELWDTEDAEREAEELETKKRKHAESTMEVEEALPDGIEQNGHAGGADQGETATDAMHEDMMASKSGAEVDPNDPIMKAMMAEMAAPNVGAPPAVVSMGTPPTRPPTEIAAQNATTTITSNAAPRPNSALADMFGDDEDDQPQRQLRMLNYSEDELAGCSGASPSDPKAAVKKLMDSIPTSRAGVFAYPIKWDVYDPTILGPNITKWVDRKITELLGMEEQSLVSFVMARLSEKTSPQDMLSQLSEVLDEEAEVFIVKLYRMVIYETEKLTAGF
ncbi:hypothetical protein BSKO_13230 [Bryopsis sp. KO-2023]|nr:hypothetical protein BSKO_13230 [Bryopsis sp. KO-2023]